MSTHTLTYNTDETSHWLWRFLIATTTIAFSVNKLSARGEIEERERERGGEEKKKSESVNVNVRKRVTTWQIAKR